MRSYQFPPQISDLMQKHLSSGQYRNEDEVLLAALHSLASEEQEWHAVNERILRIRRAQRRPFRPEELNDL